MQETISNDQQTSKPWQRGFPLDLLRSIAQRFQAHDEDRCLGAFAAVKETAVASWLAEERLLLSQDAAVAYRVLRTRQTVTDWRGLPIAEVPSGSVVIERAAGPAAALGAAIESLSDGGPVVWRSWADHPAEQEAAALLGLVTVGSLVRASSEVLAVRARGVQAQNPVMPQDRVGIAPLGIAPGAGLVDALQQWPLLVEQAWVDHYSSYNKRQSWHAVALRSFGGSPTFIEKPSEMSRRYQREHPERLSWPILDTALMDTLPGARDVLASLDCTLERVRLMRLTGGGELSRHADITDRAAGTRVGQIARLHLPIITEPSVRFTSWSLGNKPTTVHMSAGSWWYLDVRKPHRAINPSACERVHLVADCVVTPRLQRLIAEAA
jgi:hypothetical protein